MPRKQYTTHFIYKTTCLITDKFYIGMHSTFNIDDEYLGSGKYLRNSIKKYGKENHKREIIEFCIDKEILKSRERKIINKQLLKNNDCMNIAPGGGGGWCCNNNSDIQRKKAFIANKKIKEYYSLIPEWCEKRSKNISIVIQNQFNTGQRKKVYFYDWTGKIHSLESIEKMKISHIGLQNGEKNSQYGTCWITNGKENKKIKKNTEIPIGWKLGRKFNKISP